MAGGEMAGLAPSTKSVSWNNRWKYTYSTKLSALLGMVTGCELSVLLETVIECELSRELEVHDQCKKISRG